MSSSNPFNNILDWSFRGKKVEVKSMDGGIWVGWMGRFHFSKGSVVLHDASRVGKEDDFGSVYIRQVAAMAEIGDKQRKEIRLLPVAEINPHPEYPVDDVEPVDTHMRRASRDGFSGSFPVVYLRNEDDEYYIINGHKRILACQRVGLDYHPVEFLDVTDEEALELLRLAHRGESDE